MAMELADALAAAHAAGIVHRDLKPANVMIGRDGTVKVLDFGLSKSEVDRTVESVKTDTLSSSGSLLGTAPYMAPEVIDGGVADARSDIFSLGIVLFEMTTGRRPFTGNTALAVITAILRDKPPLASAVKPGVPRDLARLIDRCMAKNPSERRQSAADLRTDLADLAKRLEGGESLVNASAIPLRRASSARRPIRAALVGAAAAVALLTIGATVGQYATSAPTAAGDSRLVRFSVDLPSGRALPAGFNSTVAISRDGSTIAYTPLRGPVMLRRVNDLMPHAASGFGRARVSSCAAVFARRQVPLVHRGRRDLLREAPGSESRDLWRRRNDPVRLRHVPPRRLVERWMDLLDVSVSGRDRPDARHGRPC